MDVQDELIDRFGDMPKPVQNLLNVALVKAVAADCYITSLSILSEEILIKFSPSAPYDIDKIMKFITENKAKLMNSGGMAMVLSEKNSDKARVCANLPKKLEKLKMCLDS